MNRATALLLALATLLAHTLAIHDTREGEFAPPFDRAHAAFRVARNVVHEGDMSWNTDEEPLESYPSPLWVAIGTIPERLYVDPVTFSQTLGILFALATVVLVARFSPGRLAGVIAPLLLVFSGGLASAAASGDETTLFALLLTGCFLAYEARRPVALGILLALLFLTAAEGVLFALAILAFELVRRRRGTASLDAPGMIAAFAPPLLVFVLASFVREAVLGHVLPAPLATLLDPEMTRWDVGFLYVRDFFLRSGIPLLVIFSIVHMLTGDLPGQAGRALILAGLWTLIVARNGADGRPFWCALVPMLPLLFVAVQAGMTVTIDSGRRYLAVGTWGAFLAALAISATVSKNPGNVGPIAMEGFMRRWMRPEEKLYTTYYRDFGRRGLRQEISQTQRLRSIGLYLRDRVDPGATILTPWPGAIGYLSRKRVYDLLGRVTLAPGEERLASWWGQPKVDLVASIARQPDYIICTLTASRRPPVVRLLAQQWLRLYDVVGDTPQRFLEFSKVMSKYELVSIPVPVKSDRPSVPSGPPVYILRHKGLKRLQPKVLIECDGDEFRVLAQHRGHHQLVDLEVRLLDRDGKSWGLRPTGQFELDSVVHARMGVLLYPSGTRRVQLLRGHLPDDVDAVELSAVLRNPGSHHELNFSTVSPWETVKIRQ